MITEGRSVHYRNLELIGGGDAIHLNLDGDGVAMIPFVLTFRMRDAFSWLSPIQNASGIASVVMLPHVREESWPSSLLIAEFTSQTTQNFADFILNKAGARIALCGHADSILSH